MSRLFEFYDDIQGARRDLFHAFGKDQFEYFVRTRDTLSTDDFADPGSKGKILLLAYREINFDGLNL
jgi:hypothetical protein